MSAAVFEAYMLQHHHLGRNDVELLGRFFADAVRRAVAAGADLLRLGQVVFYALAAGSSEMSI